MTNNSEIHDLHEPLKRWLRQEKEDELGVIATEAAEAGSLHAEARGYATWHAETLGIKNGKWASGTKEIRVRVLAVAEGYAMVRRKGAMPTVVSLKQLSHIEKLSD